MKRIVWILVAAIAFILLVFYLRAAFASDSFVRLIEARQGIYPGQTKVLPECSCTVRYLGTKINGRVYSVILEKLD